MSHQNMNGDLPTPLPYSEWPETLIGPVWLYGTDHPVTLYASVVKADEHTTTVVVENTATPDFAPQTLTRFDNERLSPARPLTWAGQQESDGTTTRWACDFKAPAETQRDGKMVYDLGAKCATTSGRDLKDEDLKLTATEAECFVLAREAFALTTAGIDKLKDTHEIYVTAGPNYDPSKLQDMWRENYEKVCSNDELKSAAKTTAAAASTGETGDDSEKEATKTPSGDNAKETGDASDDGDGEDGDDEDKDSAGARVSAGSFCVALMALTLTALFA